MSTPCDMEAVDSCPPNMTDNITNVKELLADASEEKIYEYFSLTAWDAKEILESFEVLKDKLGLAKKSGLDLYRGLKITLGSQNGKAWKARDMMNLLDKRANQKEYAQQKAAAGIRVFIVGGGPVGLRLAIDCLLLGAEVVVVEKRTTFSRNNVLHLWPFTIEDLKALGAKKFYGKFCAGAIDHISIRSLQCILLKVALLLGVKFHNGLEFLEIEEPDSQIGWHAKLNPSDHPLNLFEFDILVGADGARKSRVPGFDRKELRGKLALAITANFRNKFTREEAAVQEISGVAFIFNQKFFKDLKEDTDIDLENIVYYKDDTHYFVMTAKKDSLLTKEVLLADYSDTRQLLHPNNINMGKLYEYAEEAADWSTDSALGKLEFMINHHNQKDVALFDFTSIHQAEYAAQAINRRGKDLFLCLAGDALLEPFWPIGTGCARGFLSAMDTAWLVRRMGQKKPVLDILCERECIFQRLPQTTPENLTSNIKAYTIDPKSRYPNLHLHRVRPSHVEHMYDTDQSMPSPARRQGSVKVKRSAEAAGVGVTSKPASRVVSDAGEVIEEEGEGEGEDKENVGPIPIEKKRKQEREISPLSVSLMSPKKRSLNERGSIHLAYYAEPEDACTLNDPMVLQRWLQKQVEGYGIAVTDLTTSWRDGMALCALIYHYHPELIPDFKKLSPRNPKENNKRAFTIAEEHFGISPLLKPEEMKKPDKLTLLSYLSLFYELFLDSEPALAPSDEEVEPMLTEDPVLSSTPVTKGGHEVSEGASEDRGSQKKKRKRSLFRRSSKKKLLGASPSSVDRSWNTKGVKRDMIESPPTSPPVSKVTGGTSLTTIQEKQVNGSTPKVTRTKPPVTTLGFKPPSADSSDFCFFCSKRVYLMERMSANGFFFHRTCFRCSHCNCQLKIGGYSLSKGVGNEKGKFFCSAHYRQLFLSNPEAINYSRAGFGGGTGEKTGAGGGGEASKRIQEDGDPPEANRELSPQKESTPTPSTDDEETGKTEKKKKSMGIRERLRTWSKGRRSASRSRSRSRSRSLEPEDLSQSPEGDEVEEHRSIIQTPKSETKIESTASGPLSNGETMEVDPIVMRSLPKGSGMVQRLSMGFEKLEANARETEIQPGPLGRERAKSQLSSQPPESVPQPYKTQRSLTSIQEGKEDGSPRYSRPAPPPPYGSGKESPRDNRPTPPPPYGSGRESPRYNRPAPSPPQGSGRESPRYNRPAPSPPQGREGGSPRYSRPAPPPPEGGRGTRKNLQQSRPPPDQVKGIQRSSRSVVRRPQKKGRGQKSISRPQTDIYDTSDVAIQERRKQQKRFRDAQLIQREMSQLERQYDELEEFGRQIEQELREAEETKQEVPLMKSWLNLVNEKNGLIRKTSELSLRMKELELEDRQYEIDKKLSTLSNLPEGFELTEEEMAEFEELCTQKIKIVEERDELVNQTEEERLRELEEDDAQDVLNDKMKGSDSSDESFDNISGSDIPSRRGSAPARVAQSTEPAPTSNDKAQPKRKSWFPFGK